MEPLGKHSRLIKRIVRSSPALLYTSADLGVEARGVQGLESFAQRRSILKDRNDSGIDLWVALTLVGGLFGLFLLLVLVSGICKLTNKPRSEAKHNFQSRPMYQPSAAGYQASSLRNYPERDTPEHSSANLLDSASPMGMGGRYEDGDVSGSQDDDRSHQSHPSKIPGTHSRGLSSGVNLPGPPAAVRRGAGGQHPQLGSYADEYDTSRPGQGPSTAPDGSGFQPGQVFDYNAVGGPIAAMYARQGPPGGGGSSSTGGGNVYPPRSSSNGTGAGGPHWHRNNKSISRGPPPATNGNRQSRYARNNANMVDPATRRSRIDSVGPGTYRKSMFMNDDEPQTLYGHKSKQPSNHGGLRRVESIGKGDARRASNYHHNGSSRTTPAVPNGHGGLTVVDTRELLLSARAEGFGGGKGSGGGGTTPMKDRKDGGGGRSPSPAGMMGPLGPSGMVSAAAALPSPTRSNYVSATSSPIPSPYMDQNGSSFAPRNAAGQGGGGMKSGFGLLGGGGGGPPSSSGYAYPGALSVGGRDGRQIL
ncbi:hypothetical protein IE53DRAFT_241233 [Violaceomyces palustris]|uniref:Uncharacterized protein n=1 Tax=Violaceomyces palustris TaxID=1673888 RepID=A0ACD0NPC4_9BASI|nr:hypothetical protein IE53DRAFT_241233 [Violaceomyces palustris]